jgi:hypothetical protein
MDDSALNARTFVAGFFAHRKFLTEMDLVGNKLRGDLPIAFDLPQRAI